MIGQDSYGAAEVVRREDGTLKVVRADEVIGISVELLAEALGFGLLVGDDGLLWLGGDPAYRYRPTRFVAPALGLTSKLPVEGARVVVCERVR